MSAFQLKVNGATHEIDADGTTPLLYVLRNDLGLNGAKFGCGLGQCGACTVHIDGAPARSCIVPLSSIGDSQITTLEGLGGETAPHPVQAAFIEEQAMQCGYCANGMIMTAAAVLARNPAAGESDMRSALSGNLCRCGTHSRILRAAMRAVKGAG